MKISQGQKEPGLYQWLTKPRPQSQSLTNTLICAESLVDSEEAPVKLDLPLCHAGRSQSYFQYAY